MNYNFYTSLVFVKRISVFHVDDTDQQRHLSALVFLSLDGWASNDAGLLLDLLRLDCERKLKLSDKSVQENLHPAHGLSERRSRLNSY
jgi:hypothetical protein